MIKLTCFPLRKTPLPYPTGRTQVQRHNRPPSGKHDFPVSIGHIPGLTSLSCPEITFTFTIRFPQKPRIPPISESRTNSSRHNMQLTDKKAYRQKMIQNQIC